MRIRSIPDTRRLSWAILLMLLASGCSETVDPLKSFDQQVETRFFNDFPNQDALTFFRQGGHLCDTDTESLDQEWVLPLLEDLHAQFDVHPVVVASETAPQQGLALVMSLPEGTQRDAVMSFLTERQQTFPAEIMLSFGHNWLGLDFLTPSERRHLDEKLSR